MKNRRHAGILENSEAKRLFAAFFIIGAFFCALVAAGTFLSARQTQEQLVQREYAVAGNLLRGGADKELVIRAFTGAAAQGDAAQGAQALAREGYTRRTASLLLPFLTAGEAQRAALALGGTAVFLLLLGGACARTLRGIYDKTEEAALAAIELSRGGTRRLPENGEGAFARLYHAFNEMAAGVDVAFEKLQKERLFLKNLLSDISHQLKTPLAALKMYNEIILQEHVSGTVRDFSEKSGAQIERMEWLVLGLLKTARVEAGSLHLQMQPSDAAALAGQEMENFRETAGQKGVALRLQAAEPVPLVCDEGWLREAVGNVIKNCVEHTPEGGAVTVGAQQTPVAVSIVVCDSGEGIHPDDLPHIFQRFYRGRGSRAGGSGIGLSLARSIAEQMGGTLSAQNRPGAGAEFTFTFLKRVL